MRKKLILALLFLTGSLEGDLSQAATYNFYFNNTEQGAHSSAIPAVTIHQNGSLKNGGDSNIGAKQKPSSHSDTPNEKTHTSGASEVSVPETRGSNDFIEEITPDTPTDPDDSAGSQGFSRIEEAIVG